MIFHWSRENPWVYEVVLQADAQGQMYPQYEVLRNREPIQGHTRNLFKFLESTPHKRHIFDKKQRPIDTI